MFSIASSGVFVMVCFTVRERVSFPEVKLVKGFIVLAFRTPGCAFGRFVSFVIVVLGVVAPKFKDLHVADFVMPTRFDTVYRWNLCRVFLGKLFNGGGVPVVELFTGDSYLNTLVRWMVFDSTQEVEPCNLGLTLRSLFPKPFLFVRICHV